METAEIYIEKSRIKWIYIDFLKHKRKLLDLYWEIRFVDDDWTSSPVWDTNAYGYKDFLIKYMK